MTVKIKGKFSSYESNVSGIMDLIDRNEFERRRDAAKYAVGVMRKNISTKGRPVQGGYPRRRTGTLRRKVGFQLIKQDRSAKVGSKDFKAHLLEFGHGDGKERNKRPFVFRSLREAEDEIIKIMSREYF